MKIKQVEFDKTIAREVGYASVHTEFELSKKRRTSRRRISSSLARELEPGMFLNLVTLVLKSLCKIYDSPDDTYHLSAPRKPRCGRFITSTFLCPDPYYPNPHPTTRSACPLRLHWPCAAWSIEYFSFNRYFFYHEPYYYTGDCISFRRMCIN